MKSAAAMPTILLRMLQLHKLLSSIFLYLVPNKLRTYLPPSWYQHQHEREPTRIMDPDELKRVFQMFDHNGDRRITRDDLSRSLENMGIFILDAELAHMIAKIDANEDGCVDMDEFRVLYLNIMSEGDEETREAFNVFDTAVDHGDGLHQQHCLCLPSQAFWPPEMSTSATTRSFTPVTFGCASTQRLSAERHGFEAAKSNLSYRSLRVGRGCGKTSAAVIAGIQESLMFGTRPSR
ncbi:Calmodulin-like protein 4 [Striga hermonthica]|uniref:Calmodulin-like protein 4 n=1 Tax=Striga hermonthica TaxID=68872 RepID=A0A9N7N0L3_STRHE|nr:Calmodulin-like protein 4 [Striga hermonthica]